MRVAGASAIARAATRPMLRFVAVKSAGKPVAGLTFKTRDLPRRQKTQAINAVQTTGMKPRGCADPLPTPDHGSCLR